MVADGKMPLSEIPFEDVAIGTGPSHPSASSHRFPPPSDQYTNSRAS
jgi:hypothetical protein